MTEARAMVLSMAVTILLTGPPMTHAQAPASGKRFPQITVEQLTPAQRPTADEILKVSSVGLAGPYNPMLRSPIFAATLEAGWRFSG